mgnify:CR=1 FL=1
MKNLKFIITFFASLLIIVGCKPDIEGCTDPKADNYDAFATVDAKNCIYDGVLGGPGNTDSTLTPISGCMDSTAANYNPLATIDDGSCEFLGCTDPESDNYDPNANVDDGSCIDKREKLEKNLGSIADMTRLPGAIFVVDIKKEHIAIAEAQNLNIPIFAMVDTNSDPRLVDFVIPSNDDASKSIDKVLSHITNAIAEGLSDRKADKDKGKDDQEEVEEVVNVKAIETSEEE